MPAPIKITKPVPPGGKPPAMKIEFRGEAQRPFFEFRKIAMSNFNTDATTLGRLLVLDFVKEHREFPHSKRTLRLAQQVIGFEDRVKNSAIPAEKKAQKRKGAK